MLFFNKKNARKEEVQKHTESNFVNKNNITHNFQISNANSEQEYVIQYNTPTSVSIKSISFNVNDVMIKRFERFIKPFIKGEIRQVFKDSDERNYLHFLYIGNKHLLIFQYPSGLDYPDDLIKILVFIRSRREKKFLAKYPDLFNDDKTKYGIPVMVNLLDGGRSKIFYYIKTNDKTILFEFLDITLITIKQMREFVNSLKNIVNKYKRITQ